MVTYVLAALALIGLLVSVAFPKIHDSMAPSVRAIKSNDVQLRLDDWAAKLALQLMPAGSEGLPVPSSDFVCAPDTGCTLTAGVVLDARLLDGLTRGLVQVCPIITGSPSISGAHGEILPAFNGYRGDLDAGRDSVVLGLIYAGPNAAFERTCAGILSAPVALNSDDAIATVTVAHVRERLNGTAYLPPLDTLAGVAGQGGDVRMELSSNTLKTYQGGSWVAVAADTLGVHNVTRCDANEVAVDASVLADGSLVKGFCMAKHEMSADPDNAARATSRAGSLPLTVSQFEAQALCEASDKALISDEQWTAAANQFAAVAANWTSGVVGQGSLYSGHSDGVPSSTLAAASEDSQGYAGTGNAGPSNQRRTLLLSSGAVVWDFAGNAAEWTSTHLSTLEKPLISGGDYTGFTDNSGSWEHAYRFDLCGFAQNSAYGGCAAGQSAEQSLLDVLPRGWIPAVFPSAAGSDQGFGAFWRTQSESSYNNQNQAPDLCTGYCGSYGAVLRGGSAISPLLTSRVSGVSRTIAFAGIYSLDLRYGGNFIGTNNSGLPPTGFRCVGKN